MVNPKPKAENPKPEENEQRFGALQAAGDQKAAEREKHRNDQGREFGDQSFTLRSMGAAIVQIKTVRQDDGQGQADAHIVKARGPVVDLVKTVGNRRLGTSFAI